MWKRRLAFAVFLVAAAGLASAVFMVPRDHALVLTDANIQRLSWEGYKHSFIGPDGRVRRPQNGNDTVSEGQAYAMLRAVCMDDKGTFDRCYRWTEKHLSRTQLSKDSLLAWRWKNSKVAQWMPATDADLDYSLSLLLADRKWGNTAPEDLGRYSDKAEKVLEDILTYETISVSGGRLYLLPWILDAAQKSKASFPQNPSYYSPAHFRIFYEKTKDPRWLALVDTCYRFLKKLSREYESKDGSGLWPDWCQVDQNERFSRLEGKNDGFGWEAVRIPFRVALDYYWFGSKEAKALMSSGFSRFIEDQWASHHAVYCEYDRSGRSVKHFESALFYSAYFTALRISGSPLAEELHLRLRKTLKKRGPYLYYSNEKEYYVNSLAWLSEYFLTVQKNNS